MVNMKKISKTLCVNGNGRVMDSSSQWENWQHIHSFHGGRMPDFVRFFLFIDGRGTWAVSAWLQLLALQPVWGHEGTGSIKLMWVWSIVMYVKWWDHGWGWGQCETGGLWTSDNRKRLFYIQGQHFWRGGSMHTTNLMHTGPVWICMPCP